MLFIVGSVYILLGLKAVQMEQRDGILTISSFCLYAPSIFTGACFLIILCNIVVRKADIYPVESIGLEYDSPAINIIKIPRVGKHKKIEFGDGYLRQGGLNHRRIYISVFTHCTD
jgi:hypothetical protein